VKRGNQPVPFGAVVRETQSGVTSMVGDDGQIYLSGLPLEGELLIQWGDGMQSQCRAHYAYRLKARTRPLPWRGQAVIANRNPMMNIFRNVAGVALLCALPAWATVCQNSNGVAKDISYDLSNVFNSSNNKPGRLSPWRKNPGWWGQRVCPKGTTGKSTMRSYVTDYPLRRRSTAISM
jgi:hypothetical protein